MKRIITKTLLVIFSIGMVITLVLNFFLQIYLDNKEFRETAGENFLQIERILERNEQELEKLKEDFAVECIVRARAAAYIAQYYPDVIRDKEECKLVASLLQVDELHFFTVGGVIYAGTHPEYYGYTFSSGGQIGYFAPMLENYELEICQDIMPNTAEGKLMQYAAVWRKDKKGIVQVGLEPKRVLKAIEGNSISDIFSMISTDAYSNFYAVDAQSNEILGSTKKDEAGKTATEIGLQVENVSENLSWGHQTVNGESQHFVTKKAGNLILVKTCPSCEIHSGVVGSTLLLCVYLVVLFVILIASSYVLLERKIIRSILNINRELKKIEQGKWDTVLSENTTEEFAQLSSYINSMVGSLLNFTGKVSKALELCEVPIGICEYVPGVNRFMATSRVKDILMLTDEEFNEFSENPEKFEEKRRALCKKENCLENNIYRLKKEELHFVRVETFTYQKSKMTILIDVTRDIQEKQSIEEERDTDLLTGLYNRRAFFRKMEELFENPEQLKTAVMLGVDLDNLKVVNDLHGHASGDSYLLAFAECLHSCGVEEKVAARIGGDEFALFAYGLEGKTEADEIIAKLLSCRGSRSVMIENGEDVWLEFSVGWAFYPDEKTDYQNLIKLADTRMYKDKKIRKEKK